MELSPDGGAQFGIRVVSGWYQGGIRLLSGWYLSVIRVVSECIRVVSGWYQSGWFHGGIASDAEVSACVGAAGIACRCCRLPQLMSLPMGAAADVPGRVPPLPVSVMCWDAMYFGTSVFVGYGHWCG